MKLFKYTSTIFLLLFCITKGLSQIDYSSSREYTIRSIIVESPSQDLNKNAVKILSGLYEGQLIKVPGDEISEAIKKLWKQQTFTNIQIYQLSTDKSYIDLAIYVEEIPRLSSTIISGIHSGFNRSESDNIYELVKTKRGDHITEFLLKDLEYRIKNYYADKNYFDAQVEFSIVNDTMPNAFPGSKMLKISVDKRDKVKVGRITVEGNEDIKLSKIRRKFKDALYEKSRFDVFNNIVDLFKGEIKGKEVDSMILADGFYESAYEYFKNAIRINIFSNSKYNKSELENVKEQVIDLFNAKGYRDAQFVRDSVYYKDGEIFADFTLKQGRKYYFRNINWVGNKRYRTGQLDTLIGIKKGDIYNLERLNTALNFSQTGFDVTSLYQDNGYLFFNIEPVEIAVVGDSIDLEIRIYEGKQARIGRINIIGNSKTNDMVVLRELRVKPGDLFSRSALIRSQQALAQLGIFDAQSIDFRPKPNPVDGTVDLDIIVVEAPSDQIELSGGWGNNQLVGTLGLSFNNFSLRNILKKSAWSPLPSGDGQKLSIRAQSNGSPFQSYSFNFTEPWLGGKKPISFGVFFSHTNFQANTNFTNSSSSLFYRLQTTTAGLNLGTMLKWPDDFFSFQASLAYQRYDVINYNLIQGQNRFTGVSNNFNLTLALNRISTDDQIFPTSGSNISASVEATLPMSQLFGYDVTSSIQSKYNWLEYHKWKLRAQWFIPLSRSKYDASTGLPKPSKFVLMVRGEIGVLGYYNPAIGLPAFERFFVGGDGLQGFNIDGREIIALRGYQNNALTPGFNGSSGAGGLNSLGSATGGAVYSKYTMEFRYLISPNPQSKIFALAFLEAGNCFSDARDFQPFRLNRSAGVGIRIFLPMFGLLGVDWGYGFDPIPGIPESTRQKSNFHFMIGQQF